MKHFVYILHSESVDRYYIGSCVDIQKRLQRHNAGATQSTKPYRPWQLVHAEEYATKTEALIRENYIKRMKSSTYIKSEFDFNVLVE